MAKNLAELCLSAFWKVEPASKQPGYVAEETAKQSGEEEALFLPLLTNKMQGERDKSKELFKKKKESELEDLEHSETTRTAKLEKAHSENTKDVAGQPSGETIRMGVNHTFPQPSQKTPGFRQWKRCRLGQKEMEEKGAERRKAPTCLIIQDEGRTAPEVIQRCSVRAAIPTTAPEGKTASTSVFWGSERAACAGGVPAESQGRKEGTGHSEEPTGTPTTPGDLGATIENQRGSSLNLKISWNWPISVLDSLGACHPFLPSDFPLWE